MYGTQSYIFTQENMVADSINYRPTDYRKYNQ